MTTIKCGLTYAAQLVIITETFPPNLSMGVLYGKLLCRIRRSSRTVATPVRHGLPRTVRSPNRISPSHRFKPTYGRANTYPPQRWRGRPR